jgi:hypothetical protein
MFQKQFSLALLIILTLAGSASAGFEVRSGDGPWLDIRPDETESDALLRLGCHGYGLIDAHIGGIFDIGEGGHEAVSVTLSAGALTAKVRGLSIYSEDSELTGGSELLTALMAGDDAFAVLTSGMEITLQGARDKDERFTLGAEATAELKAFIEKCS